MYEIILNTGQRLIASQANINTLSAAVIANSTKPVSITSGKNTTLLVRPDKVDAIFPLK